MTKSSLIKKILGRPNLSVESKKNLSEVLFHLEFEKLESIEDLELKHVMHRKATDSNDERLDFFFACGDWEGEVQNMEPHKCDDLNWTKINELPDNLIPYVRLAIVNSLVNHIPYSGLHW